MEIVHDLLGTIEVVIRSCKCNSGAVSGSVELQIRHRLTVVSVGD